MKVFKPETLIYPELSYKIVGLCFHTHNEIGRFAKEKQYGDFLEKMFNVEKVNYIRELVIADTGNIVDFLVENKIILELKTTRIIGKREYFQLQRYLNITGIKLGILVNFRSVYLNPKRIVLKDS